MMVPQASTTAAYPLRLVTQRLNSTPINNLPLITSQLAEGVLSCKDVFSASEPNGSDLAVLVHKYKTRLSSLLQDKSIEGRWTAVVLIKVTVEVGAWNVLREVGSWVRGLLGILGVREDLFENNLDIKTEFFRPYFVH